MQEPTWGRSCPNEYNWSWAARESTRGSTEEY